MVVVNDDDDIKMLLERKKSYSKDKQRWAMYEFVCILLLTKFKLYDKLS